MACQGIFSSVIKDITGSKAKHVPDVETEVTRASIEDLEIIFSTANFLSDTGDRDDLAMDEDEIDIDIGKIALLVSPSLYAWGSYASTEIILSFFLIQNGTLRLPTTWSFVCEDDIDLEDIGEKPKEQNMLTAINKQKLASKLQALKG